MNVLRPADEPPAVDSSPRPANVFRVLVRHFFDRFFDKESISPQGEPEAAVIQTLGILAVPGAFFVLLFRPLTLLGWDLVAVRYMFVLYSMVVMGLIMVFEWDALFPDRRDYQILTPAPIRLSTVFLAKAAALAIFLGMFLLDINFFGFLFWPGVDGGKNAFDILRAHVIAVLAGGLFSALAVSALQGLLITFLPGRAYRRVSVALQTLMMAALVMLFFLIPLISFGTRHLVERNSPLLYWFPGYWFIGFYEQLRPTVYEPKLLSLGNLATAGLLVAAAVFLLTYLPGYRRHARRAVETLEPGASGPGRLRAWFAAVLSRTILRSPVQHAVFHFITESITRSVKHRLFLATYGGFGAAVAILSLGGGRTGLLTLPLSLSFVLVSGLRAAFNFPSELQANWAFQISELSPVGRVSFLYPQVDPGLRDPASVSAARPRGVRVLPARGRPLPPGLRHRPLDPADGIHAGRVPQDSVHLRAFSRKGEPGVSWGSVHLRVHDVQPHHGALRAVAESVRCRRTGLLCRGSRHPAGTVPLARSQPRRNRRTRLRRCGRPYCPHAGSHGAVTRRRTCSKFKVSRSTIETFRW